MDSRAAEIFVSVVSFLSLFQKLPETLVLGIRFYFLTEIVQSSNIILLQFSDGPLFHPDVTAHTPVFI